MEVALLPDAGGERLVGATIRLRAAWSQVVVRSIPPGGWMLSLGERWQFWAEVRFRPLSGKGTGRPTTAPGARASRLQRHI